MRIKKVVENLVSEYQTRNPYELAKLLGIIVIEENLGTINGYYNEVLGVKFIHINENLSKFRKKFTVAHELGHAILHPNFNYHFLKNYTLFNINRFEKEANKFALSLILGNDANDLKTVEEVIYQHEWSENYGVCECP